MANAVVTVKIMPQSPDIDLMKIEGAVGARIDAFTKAPGQKRFEIEPVAFGLKALKVKFVMDENIGSTDALEQELARIDGVQSVDVVDVRRTIG
jgi:elongation factor 1-beta